MKLVNSITVFRPPAAIWAFLVNPENMLLWNPKVRRVSPSSGAEPGLGYRYAITYQMRESAPPADFLAEFVHFEPGRRLVIRHTGERGPRDRVIEEIYELTERGNGTFLKQTIQIENSGINIFLRMLIWAIQRWGRPTGRPYLATLRDYLEDNARAATTD